MTTRLAARLGAVLILGVSCGDLDRGRCLRSHVVAYHTDETFSCTPTIGFDGDVGISCATEPARDWTVTICDEWEFPNGKAERDQ